ncbi:SWIM zinc finger family protein [Kineococcus sp. SYSU DK005]|uniref:SWIM zinc finger family protein n=1 Tax=Kineococcus sp. SYSU DK005 TaxID=3383126 RepID=UPI003D7C7B03
MAHPRRPSPRTSAGPRAARPAAGRWSRRLLTALPAALAGAHDPARWRRGAELAAAGAVGELRVRAGAVGARVQGARPRPWLVEVGVRRHGPAEVDALVAVLVENPLLIAPLAGGDVPPVLPDLLAEVGLDLLPAPGELTHDCSCPDDGERACEHAAAVLHALAAHTDAEPSALLVLRGLAPSGLLRRVESAASGPAPVVEELPADPVAFHRLAADPPPLAVAPRVPGRTPADDLDAVALGPGGDGIADALRPFYAALREAGAGAGGSRSGGGGGGAGAGGLRSTAGPAPG